uniref:Uncharacterized protein n=1 Tax=Anopheles atroparvus TaxID=41427 RepID=A0AAG5DU81_ANOAO
MMYARPSLSCCDSRSIAQVVLIFSIGRALLISSISEISGREGTIAAFANTVAETNSSLLSSCSAPVYVWFRKIVGVFPSIIIRMR